MCTINQTCSTFLNKGADLQWTTGRSWLPFAKNEPDNKLLWRWWSLYFWQTARGNNWAAVQDWPFRHTHTFKCMIPQLHSVTCSLMEDDGVWFDVALLHFSVVKANTDKRQCVSGCLIKIRHLEYCFNAKPSLLCPNCISYRLKSSCIFSTECTRFVFFK